MYKILKIRKSENTVAKKKKKKKVSAEEKEKYNASFEGQENVFIIEKLARDVIEGCKLPEANKPRKKKQDVTTTTCTLKRISVRYSGDAYSFQCGMQSVIWGE